MSFSDYNLDPFVLKYLTRQKITKPTAIQAQAIPVALDVISAASRKYIRPIVDRSLKNCLDRSSSREWYRPYVR